MFAAKSSTGCAKRSVTYSPVGCGHAMREVWGAGLGLGLGGALYYNRPANSVFSGGVCIRTMAERVWLGASRGSEVHALQVELELEAGEPSSRVEPASGRQSVGTVWHARGETLHQQATFDLSTAAGGWREAWRMKFRRKRDGGEGRLACLVACSIIRAAVRIHNDRRAWREEEKTEDVLRVAHRRGCCVCMS
jgi:hypothetical protein